MDPFAIQQLVSDLTDLELAVLLALIRQEHCVIETNTSNVENVAGELALICQKRFDLDFAIINCSADLSVNEFVAEIFVSGRGKRSVIDTEREVGDRAIVNVVLAQNFNRATQSVHLLALELIRSRRVLINKSTHTAPQTFLFIPVIGYDDAAGLHVRLNKHLNECFLFSHYHDLEAGLPNLEGDEGWPSDGQASTASVVQKMHQNDDQSDHDRQLISAQTIRELQSLSNAVSVSADVMRYLHNIVVFLRLNRAVAGGISASATKSFVGVAKTLAAMHGMDYLTPSLVCLAAKKVYRHRIVVARPKDDRSLQYGSQIESVARLLEGVTADQIIDTVLLQVEVPL